MWTSCVVIHTSTLVNMCWQFQAIYPCLFETFRSCIRRHYYISPMAIWGRKGRTLRFRWCVAYVSVRLVGAHLLRSCWTDLADILHRDWGNGESIRGRWRRSTPPRVVSEDFLVTGFPNFSRPNFPIPGSQKFFPNYKFITPRLLMCLRNSRSPTNRQWHSYLYLYTMWGGYKHYVIWRYVSIRAWCLLDLRQRDYGSLFWSFHVRRLHV